MNILENEVDSKYGNVFGKKEGDSFKDEMKSNIKENIIFKENTKYQYNYNIIIKSNQKNNLKFKALKKVDNLLSINNKEKKLIPKL